MAEYEEDDDLDDLADYDIEGIKTTFDTSINAEAGTSKEGITKTDDKKVEELGVDEEIKIRKRKATVKLDEARLLSAAGIPYVIEHAPKKIKFKGKGHEIADLSRILKFYQLWADSLYPKAQFRDVLSIVQKLGHSRSMQRHRVEWVDAYRNKERKDEAELIAKSRAVLAQDEGYEIMNKQPNEQKRLDANDDEDPESLYTAYIPTNTTRIASDTGNENAMFLGGGDEDDSDMDELDAIMREAERAPGTLSSLQKGSEDGPDMDELDELDAIMAEVDQASSRKPVNEKEKGPARRKATIVAEESDDEFERAMNIMAEQ